MYSGTKSTNVTNAFIAYGQWLLEKGQTHKFCQQ